MGLSDWVRLLAEIIAVPFILLQLWMGKTLLKVSQTVYGEDGKNGLRGQIKALEQHRELHGSTLQNHASRLDINDRQLVEQHGRLVAVEQRRG